MMIFFEDDGIGMPKAIVENVFKEQVRTTRLGTQGERGPGYGLPLVYKFVLARKGNISSVAVEK